jgi:hypothetical protein
VFTWWFTAALVWVLLATPISHIPWVPWSIRMRIGPTISAAELFQDDSEETLERAYVRLEKAVQNLVR